MKDSFLESSAAFVGPVGSEGGRSPSTLSIGPAVPPGGLAPGQRWSVGRKREVVLWATKRVMKPSILPKTRFVKSLGALIEAR
jgi:hypothetical protein